MYLGARQQRRNHLEGRILGGRSDQNDVAAFDVWQERILLRLVEAVDFVDEQDRPASQAAAALGVGHHGLDFLDSAQHRAKRHAIAVRRPRDQLRQRCLSDAGRPPQDQRAQLVAFNLGPERFAWAEDVFLAYEFVERLRAHSFGERAFCVCRCVTRKRIRIEQAHVPPPLCRRASYSAMPAASATFNDSTAAVGMRTGWANLASGSLTPWP